MQKIPMDKLLRIKPSAGIKRLLGDKLPDPDKATGVPRAEIYLHVTDPESYRSRALESGAKELSPLLPRDWGDTVAYSVDPDGHELAFAKGNKL